MVDTGDLHRAPLLREIESLRAELDMANAWAKRMDVPNEVITHGDAGTEYIEPTLEEALDFIGKRDECLRAELEQLKELHYGEPVSDAGHTVGQLLESQVAELRAEIERLRQVMREEVGLDPNAPPDDNLRLSAEYQQSEEANDREWDREVQRLRAENKRLREDVERVSALYVAICPYCMDKIEGGAQATREHSEQCEAHPIPQARAQARELAGALRIVEINLRDASQGWNPGNVYERSANEAKRLLARYDATHSEGGTG